MARERMVTRTVKVTEAKVMQIDINTADVKIETYELTGEFKNNEDILKHITKNIPVTIKAVAVQEVTEHEKLYGMLETDFIKSAVELDPETRKAYDVE